MWELLLYQLKYISSIIELKRQLACETSWSETHFHSFRELWHSLVSNAEMHNIAGYTLALLIAKHSLDTEQVPQTSKDWFFLQYSIQTRDVHVLFFVLQMWIILNNIEYKSC